MEGGGGGGVLMRHITEEANLTGEAEHEKSEKTENGENGAKREPTKSNAAPLREPRKSFAAQTMREPRRSIVSGWVGWYRLTPCFFIPRVDPRLTPG